MKALISMFALLTFVAGTALPLETYAQSMGTGQTVAPDTSTSTAPTSTTKKKRSSKSHHAKKKSKKSSTAQTSSARQKHPRHSVSWYSRLEYEIAVALVIDPPHRRRRGLPEGSPRWRRAPLGRRLRVACCGTAVLARRTPPKSNAST